MNHDIYIFGSATRGEVSSTSDIDVLVIPAEGNSNEYPKSWSVYSEQTIAAYFRDGRLFAWHLHLESVCVYSPRKVPFLVGLGAPAPYLTAREDVDELDKILRQSIENLRGSRPNFVFEVGITYTAIRDIAMSASWSILESPCFSRMAPYILPIPCPLPADVYSSAMLARHASTRGSDYSNIDPDRIARSIVDSSILAWVDKIRSML